MCFLPGPLRKGEGKTFKQEMTDYDQIFRSIFEDDVGWCFRVLGILARRNLIIDRIDRF